MFTSIEEATEYACEFVRRIAPEEELDTDVVARTLEVYMMDDIEGDITPEQKSQLMSNIDNPGFLESYIAQIVPNYYTAMESAVVAFLTPYFLIVQDEVA